ncbi:MAG: FAD-binding oxidoreductase [Anaerolineaceae bacterium 4572_5.2]|nr:MAG: FAD-binding oxidoreductase [Anaerolineaceae bacterium 4572_5.2]
MTKKYDAIIIGAGIVGCATAFELAKKGYKTLNIDKLESAGAGSTINSCAIVRAHYSTYDGVAMAYDNFFYWQNWEDYLETEDERGIAKFMNVGTILLKTQGHNWRRVAELYRELGVEHEEWDVTALKQQIPVFSTKSYYPPAAPEDEDNSFWQDSEVDLPGAIFTSGSGYVNDPQLATHNIQVAAEARGGEFIFNKEVVAIRQENGRVLGITLNDGQEIDAPIVVNAAGPHSFIINRMAGVEEGMNIKTRAMRHEVHHVPSPEGFDFLNDGFHTSDGDAGIYFRPETGNTILVGSEDPDCDPHEWIEDPDDFNRELTDERWRAQVYRLARRIPDLPIPRRPRGLVDLYDVSDDWLPIYDKSDLKGFYMAVGSSGHEFKNAPGVGLMMAELIEACEKGHDHDKDPLHFTTRYTNFKLNIGFYSRLRKINPDSSFSVNG